MMDTKINAKIMSKWKRVKSLARRWQRNQLINQYGAECYICHEPIEKAGDITIDHWMPLSKGGSDTLDNYRLAHDKCNHLKSNLTPQEYAEFQIGKIQWQ